MRPTLVPSTEETETSHDGYIGRSVGRLEDRRLVTGAGRYVADLRVAGLLEAAFVRSEIAHGRVRSVDAGPARDVPGVVGAYGAADLPDLPAMPAVGPRETTDGRDWPALATDRVRYVGQTVAVVVAEDRYAAEDGTDAVEVDLEPLPAVVDPTEAAEGGAVEVFGGSSNVVHAREAGEPIGEDVWEEAPVVVEGVYREQRVVPTSIEARAFLVRPEPDGGLTAWCSHQAPHGLRAGLATAFGLERERVHVVVPDVGGTFGAKSQNFPEYVAVAHVARLLGRPVRWVEDRASAMHGHTHGRGQNQRVRLAADREGRMLALETRVDADIGGYPHTGDPVPGYSMGMVQGAYDIPRLHAAFRTVVTNTTPTSAYRGAGRPEAAYAIERTVDLLARELGMDPAEVRRRNFIPPDAFPYETRTDRLYDSGDYPAALRKALEALDYEGWRAEQGRRRAAGEGAPLGIGLCSYVERSGGTPGLTEYGSVEARPDGTFLARSGSSSTGQGHETTFAQVVASALGVDISCVRVVEADTREVPRGIGSFASRSMQVGGSALHRAARGVVEEARRRVAGRRGVALEDVRYEGGSLSAGGEELSLGDLVGETGPLRVDEDFGPPQAFPFGCYAAVVEVDPELGTVRVLRLVAVDDYGVVITPMVVEGQGYGSVAQGLGQALYEAMPYDKEGNPLAGTLLEYLLPTISEMPQDLLFEETHTPNPNTPLGAKGAGESGCIGTPPAIVNAVVDALDPEDPCALQMPLTPERCWEALRAGAGSP